MMQEVMQEREEKVTACKSVFKNADEKDLILSITKKWTELINLAEKMKGANLQK